jgi:hypothetical protein
VTVFTDVTEFTVFPLGGTDGVGSMSPDGVPGALTVGVPVLVQVIQPTGFASTGVVSNVSVRASIAVSGIGSGLTVGTVKFNSRIAPTQGLPSALTFGVTTAFISMNPDSFATVGAVGDLRIAFDMNPDGVSSGVAFGDPDIVATVFVIPGPIDPSNDFGDTTILMKRLIFRPPTQTLGWGWYKRYEGVSLLKKDGVWSEVPWPTNEETQEASVYLGGGRDHAVSTALAAELVGEGYSVTEEY